jgi:hypothetical protein
MAELDPRRGTWAEYRRLVLAALEGFEVRLKALESGKVIDATQAESVRKDISALKHVVFGVGDPDGTLEVRLTRLEDFVDNHPSLVKKADQNGDGKPKLDKKMLLLLVGSIGGLIGVLKLALDIIQKLLPT